MRIVNWNVEWASYSSHRRDAVTASVWDAHPEIVCLTEVNTDISPKAGHVITSQGDYGYTVKRGRRKVALWSREPWMDTDDLGTASLPPGRYVHGTTKSSVGELSIVGICIPWSNSRTEEKRGPARKAHWEDHQAYIEGLAEIIDALPHEQLIVVGDFNQRYVSGSYAPVPLQQKLHRALTPPVNIVTRNFEHRGRGAIDHIALSNDLNIRKLSVVDNIRDGKQISDHFGVIADIGISS